MTPPNVEESLLGELPVHRSQCCLCKIIFQSQFSIRMLLLHLGYLCIHVDKCLLNFAFSNLFLSFHSTKYLGGHSDITAGSLTLSSQELLYQCYELQKFFGGCLVSTKFQKD